METESHRPTTTRKEEGSELVLRIREMVAAGDPLSELDLKGAPLANAELNGLDFSGVDLAGADLAGASLFKANLRGANLAGANLEEAEMTGADLSEANLPNARAARVGLGMASLKGANIFRADLRGATLTKADLARADLRCAHLDNARIREADLQDADCTESSFRSADLSLCDVRGASFANADLRDTRLRAMKEFQKAKWNGVDIRDVNFAGAYLLRRFVMDQNYLTEFRERGRFSRLVYYFWLITSDCGRSLFRWCMWIVAMAMLFAYLYTLVDVEYGPNPTSFSPLYFSVVTLTTLGYGDNFPLSTPAQVIAVLEVFTGYIMLGGLLSIFSNKIARRGE